MSYNPPWEATSGFCKKAAKKIQKTDKQVWLDLGTKMISWGNFGGTPEEFVKWMQGWASFLDRCGGYSVQ